MRTRNSPVLRTSDVGRESGYSVQQVRNLERDGVLPPASRTATGYRVYDRSHVHSARAYRALAAGTGPVEAKTIMRAAHAHPNSDLFALLDEAHARLARERRDLALAQEAARAISEEPIADPRPSDEMSISELAVALGIRTSTLRHWEAEGLLAPNRTAAQGQRRYSPDDVRDARIIHQLRLAGYRITPLQALMPELRTARRWNDVTAGLAARSASIEARSAALLEAAAALSAVMAQADCPS